MSGAHVSLCAQSAGLPQYTTIAPLLELLELLELVEPDELLELELLDVSPELLLELDELPVPTSHAAV